MQVSEVRVCVGSMRYPIGKSEAHIYRSHSETGLGDVECGKRTMVLANICTYCSHIII